MPWLDYSAAHPGAPHSVTGTVRVLQEVDSSELGNRRDLLVYLPPSYATGRYSYPVLYAQDGQNLFDRFTAYAGEWEFDETMERLATEGIEAIVVAIPNAGAQRLDEYSPYVEPGVGGGRAADYLRFLVDRVMPLVNAEFRTACGPASTGVVGSSLGGLFALWAYFERPEVFGLCAALSPALLFGGGAALAEIAARGRVGGRVYLDVGSREGPPRRMGRLVLPGLPRRYPAQVRRAGSLLRAKGYRAGHDLLCLQEPGGEHSEVAWARRLPGAVRFLLGPTAAHEVDPLTGPASRVTLMP